MRIRAEIERLGGNVPLIGLMDKLGAALNFGDHTGKGGDTSMQDEADGKDNDITIALASSNGKRKRGVI